MKIEQHIPGGRKRGEARRGGSGAENPQLFDIAGTETNWQMDPDVLSPPSLANLEFNRAMSGPAPFLYLQNTDRLVDETDDGPLLPNR